MASHEASVLAAASAALGRPLAEPSTLPTGDPDTLLLRCRDPAGAGTVIVKAFPRTGEGASAFAAEAAGLQFASGSGLSPGFLGADQAVRAVVMADLGAGPSLADVLLGGMAGVARSAFIEWAGACGRLAAGTAARRADFDRLWQRYLSGQPDRRHAAGLTDRVLAAPAQAAQLGVVAPEGLGAEVGAVAAATRSDDLAVFSPGDICPDNTLLAAAGIRFLDFEEAGFHSVFLDVAYLRMPFSTCWCVFRLPTELAVAAEDAYRREASLALPELADDVVWRTGVLRAAAAWTLSSMSWLLRRCLRGDASMNPDAAVSPRTRQLMRYRWQWLAAELDAAGDLPVIAALMRSLLAATERWHAPDLPLYPALARDNDATRR
jgi:hypothetical protein